MLTEENKNIDEEFENLTELQSDEEASTIEVQNNLNTETSIDPTDRLTNELSEQKDKFLRLYAEFDNFKRRTSKEKMDLIKTAGQDLITELISVLDDFERAQKISIESGNTEFYPEGMKLIHHKLSVLLANKGLKVMNTENLEFDPEQHEAIAEVPAPSDNLKGKVIDTIEKGYMLSEKIIRFAKVVVGK